MNPSSIANHSISRRQSLKLLGSAAAVGAIIMTDPFGAAPAQAATVELPLLATASTVWRYLDNNTDPATGTATPLVWTTAGYDDSSWKTGKGSFGAKNGAATGMGGGLGVTTLLNHYTAGTGSDTVPTYFFRTSFELTAEQLAMLGVINGSATYDDAFILYVNGQRATGFEDAGIDPSTNLQYGGGNGADPRSVAFTVPNNLLKAGTNTVSVALYQSRASSSDIYFDLVSLLATTSTSTAATLSDVVLNIGAQAGELGLAWYTSSTGEELAQLVTAGGDFASATSFPSAGGTATDGQQYRHATLRGLQANTSYSYRVGSEATGWSEVFTFTTKTQSGDFNFLVVGDSQIGASGNATSDAQGWATTLSKAESLLPDEHFILSVGDQVNTAGNEGQYEGFLAPAQLRRYPLVTNIGNHDVASLAYRQHFNMPNIDETFGEGNPGQSGGNYWFTYNEVLFISFNSNNQNNDRHLEYVAKIIAEQGAGKKWVIVHFHHSVFSVASHATDKDIIERRRVLPAGFSKLGVDLVLMGHDHVYTRSYLMNALTPTNPAGATGTPAHAPAQLARSVAQLASGTVVPQTGDVLYLTANSSSGSKYYEIQTGKDFYWSDVQNQEHVPNMTDVRITDETITLTTYRVTDLSVVDVVRLERPDITAPVLTVSASTTLTVGAVFDPRAGVSAVDNRDGDLSDAILITGAVDTATTGTYRLEYSVTDAAGNTVTAVRTVTVTPVSAPSVSPDIPAPSLAGPTGTIGAPWASASGVQGSGPALAATGLSAGGFLATAVAALATGAILLNRKGKRTPAAATMNGDLEGPETTFGPSHTVD
ncbi:immunoglobulin-like domain-containing protein [Arthrobacter alpinus]|uniref:immunoglobulin-like domain-containing protein n=1 Tax=Arthrobacter alpinus TaxID=656366 RepID=UPI001643FD2E|nr:immunoglobulin-like domain-containing protein [Arthrobacter alpinus]